jgi:hypothetical protein
MPENKPLKNRFDDFSAEPRPEVWSRIEAELDNKPKRRAFVWWWSAAAVLVVGLAALFFANSTNSVAEVYVHNSSKDHENVEAQAAENQKATFDTESTEIPNVDAQKTSAPSNLPSKNHVLNSKSPTKEPISSRKTPSKKKQVMQFTAIDVLEPTQDAIEYAERTLVAVPSEIWSQTDSTEEISENQPEFAQVILGDSPIEKNVPDVPNVSKWSITVNGGIYRTEEYTMLYSTFPVLPSDMSSGIPIAINESFQNYLPQSSILIAHGLGADLAYQLSPKWQLRTGFNLLMYRTKFVNENFVQRGSNYLQLALGGDYSLLQNKRFTWQIGTGVGTGLLRNQIQAGVENHWRTEWNINTALSYAIHSKWAIRLQPTSRLIISDTQVEGFGKLSKWYHGANLGLTFSF